MNRAVGLGLLALGALALGGDVKNTKSQQMGIDDEVQLIQKTMKMDSSKEKLSAAKVAVKKSRRKVAINAMQAPANDTDTSDFANISSVSLNDAGDLDIFIAGVEFNIEVVIFFGICFIFLLRCFPNMYAFRATGAYLEGEEKRKAQTAPFTWDYNEKFWFTWLWYAWAPTREQLIESCGLDAAMLLGFTDMALEILAGVGLPMLIILCPMYATMGGNAAGDDKLSHLGIGNVEMGSWIFIPVSLSTWYVVIFVQRRLFVWMRYFIEYREQFLFSLPQPQCLTVLVEGIPDEICSDTALKDYFTKMYGSGAVKAAYVVKKCSSLEAKVAEFKATDRKLKETLYWIEHNPGKPKPHFRLMHGGQDCDVYFKSELARLAEEIKAEQEQVNMEARKPPDQTDIYATNGFVTFDSRATLQQAMGTRLRIADDELVVSYPPEPADILWGDLEETVAGRFANHVLGYACVAGLFLCFMPLVVGISQAANLDNLEAKYAWFKSFTDSLGDNRDTLASTMASLGLTIMLSFLPTFLVLIFNNFFTLIASRWAQLYIQSYYFWFLVLFVLLVTAIGSSLTEFLEEVATSPFVIFSVLAQTLPMTTHFYLNYCGTQWFTHGMNILRYINLGKYLMFKRVMDPEDARAMAEPEDQDYYGMGSRSARFAFMLVLGLVFCSICPLMTVMASGNFVCCRFIYGYLIPYAESKKKDLGGNHFALQLIHVHLGLLIYLVLMTGMMLERAATYLPGIISASSFLWWAISFNKFRTKLHWEHLCYEDVVEKAPKFQTTSRVAEYRQEVLEADILQKITANTFVK